MNSSENRPSAKKRGRGRPTEHRLGENLAVAFALMREGAITDPKDISKLIGLNEDRALSILENLRDSHAAQGQSPEPILALYSPGPNEFARIGGQTPKRLRLTPTQAQACATALDSLGFTAEDPLRRSLEKAFFPVEYAAPQSEVQPTISDETRQALLICARSIAQGERVTSKAPEEPDAPDPDQAAPGKANASRKNHIGQEGKTQAQDIAVTESAEVIQAPLAFEYFGENDREMNKEHKRRFVPLSFKIIDGEWHVYGFDVDAKAARTHRADGMKNLRQEGPRVSVPVSNLEHPGEGRARLSCDKSIKGRVLSLEGAEVSGFDEETGRIIVEVPYYRGEWLPRQLLSLGNLVTIIGNEAADANLAKEMKAVAEKDIKDFNKFKKKCPNQKDCQDSK